MAALLVPTLMAACGGGSPGAGDRLQVTLDAESRTTPWSTGSLGFTVSPPVEAADGLTCRIDGGAGSTCGGSTGRVAYQGLSPGTHTLEVQVGAGGRSAQVSFRVRRVDVVVLGATPAGLMAGIAAARAGRQVAVLEPSRWIGGVMAGGLAKTDVSGDIGPQLGWIAEEFFQQTRQAEMDDGHCVGADDCPGLYDFEPRVALQVFRQMAAAEPNLWVGTGIRALSLGKQGAQLKSVDTTRGRIEAGVFIDATYEGDLMALAGVSHTLLREPLQAAPVAEIEDDAGVGAFTKPYGLLVDPYKVPGDPASGTIEFVEPLLLKPPARGSADDHLMAYNYRLCVTDDPTNRVPFTAPPGYDPGRYEGAARVAVALADRDGGDRLDHLYFNPRRTVRSMDREHYKYDLNGGSVFSTDMTAPGWNQAYPTADPGGRGSIEAAYRSYIQGLLHFWQTDPRFGALNAKVREFGLCKDEFADNGHWPYRLYTRETRRMVGEYVMNQNDLFRNGRRPPVTDGVGMGSYGIDSHVRRIVVVRGSVNGAVRDMVMAEGFRTTHLPGNKAYPVAYRSLVPRREEATNLLNPVTLSATAVAYDSLRMEPTFMVLGQAAGLAASMALDSGKAVQDLDVADLQRRLSQRGQILR